MKSEHVDRFSVVCRSLLRTQRICSISRYLLMAELWEGPLSSLSLDRRMKAYGLKNPRVLLNKGAEGLVQKLHMPDGVYWQLTKRGRLVLKQAVEVLHKGGHRSPHLDSMAGDAGDVGNTQGN